jgi:hypothetical protein
MHEFLAQYLPVIVSSLVVAVTTRQKISRQLGAHAAQVNKVIQWALAQQPAGEVPDDGTQH